MPMIISRVLMSTNYFVLSDLIARKSLNLLLNINEKFRSSPNLNCSQNSSHYYLGAAYD